ncbi:MAG: hypothetical protein JWL91_2354 [Sphingomonas bacterium]|nr:hypothetical protein [Sphingomonas bacterium]MDB5690478.1 hypothetical protein [Sphingomonas bacterium]
MTTLYEKQKKLHFDLSNVGLRAQATAVGLVQLCIELRRANVLDEPAIERIKSAVADQISLSAPRSIASQDYRRDIAARLDQLFAGEQEVGPADALSFGRSEGGSA